MSKGKVYWLTDNPYSTTGFSTVSLNVLNGLDTKGWDCYMQAHNFIGRSPKGNKLDDGTPMNFKMFGNGQQPYSQELLMPRIRELKADVFGVLLDTFMVWPWFMNLDFAPSKSLFYFPSDGGGGMPRDCHNVLRKVDMPVAMSKFAQKQVKDYYNIDVEYIPHAVDEKLFFPLKNKEEIKAKFGMQGKFVVGCVARNQGRKMLDRLFKAFKKFAVQVPNAVLLMHSDPNDVAQVFSMQHLITRLNLQNRVVFTGMNFFNSFNYSQMNEVFNAMDIYAMGTSGEGFGVPIVESMACEVPVICTDFTTTPELVVNHNAGLGVKLLGEGSIRMSELLNKGMNMKKIDELMESGTITGSWDVERGLWDDDDAAKQMMRLYKDANLRKEMGKNGRIAVLEEYTWDKVVDKFDKVMEGMIK